MQRRGGPYISADNILQHGFVEREVSNQLLQPGVLIFERAHQFTGDDTGLLLTPSAAGAVPLAEKFQVIGSASLQAADSDCMDAYFSLSDPDAAVAGLSAFDAKTGFKSAGLMVGLGYTVFDNWTVPTTAGHTRPLGDAADSPIVDTANQFTIGIGFT